MTTPITPPAQGPKGRRFTGHLREFGRDRLGFLTGLARDYGDVVPFRLGHRRAWLVSHPDLIEEALVAKNKSMHKHFALRYFKGLIGLGLLTNEGDSWRRQRRLIQPSFAPQRLLEYAQTMLELSSEMLAKWQPGQSRDIHRDISHLTMSIAARTLFEADPSKDAEEVSTVLREALLETNRRFGSLILLPDWIPTPGNRRLRASTARLNAVLSRLIDQRRQSGTEGKDLLSHLFASVHEDDGTRMNDRQLRDEIMTLFLAGHGTTANALSWAWYLLATHPEAARKVYDEVDAVLDGGPVTVEKMHRLRYVDAVVNEGMRLYPPAYIIGREATEDVELGGHAFRKGDTLFFSQWVVQRDARWFADPEVFRPERWLDGSLKGMPKYAYFPFGGGPRVCIGNNFARIEFPIILASIAKAFRFTVDADQVVTPWAAVTLRPENGIRATLTAR